MSKEQINQYFKLAPVVKRMLESNVQLDQVSQIIIAGFESLEKEYLEFVKLVNKKCS